MSSHEANTSVPSISGLPSAGSSPRARWRSELGQVEHQLLLEPDSIALRFRRAGLLSELGRLVEARDEYLHIVRQEPAHVGALNKLGDVLVATRHRQAARIAYQEAVARAPNDSLGRVNLGNFLLEESQRLASVERVEEAAQHRRGACEQFEQALLADPDCEKAHEGMCYVLADLGETARACWHREKAFHHRCIIPVPFRGESAPVPVLLLLSSTGGNVRLQGFLDDRIFQTFLVVPEFYRPTIPIPAHQLVVNAIGDVETAPGALAAAQRFLSFTKAPVINAPAAVAATGRAENARRFAAIPGVVTPLTATVTRAVLTAGTAARSLADRGFHFPLLLRARGFHTGQHFLRVECPEALSAAVSQIPGSELIAMQHLDARGRDGNTRKYRVLFVDGKLYPWHAAVSPRWKVHYFTADMGAHPERRAEDAAFLKDMPGVLGSGPMNALEKIQVMLGLDYGGIDFSLGPNRQVLLFEANATMAVNPPEAGDIWNYRRDAHKRVVTAVHEMLCKRIYESLRSALHLRLLAAVQRMMETRSCKCCTVSQNAGGGSRRD